MKGNLVLYGYRKEFKYKKVLDSYKAVIKTINLMLNNEPK